MKTFVHFSIRAGIVLLIVFLFLVFSAFMYFSSGLPDYKKLAKYQPPVSSRVYSENGTLIAEYALEKRLFIPYESIPKKIINSFLSAEDKNFFSHPGIDAKGVLRATINNFKNIINNERLEGASTITQQVAKNFLLTNEVSLKRKIKEAILAFRIEKAYSKERILELYLNQIYLGEGAYGIASASLAYFDKPISKLNFEEAALLAALPKAPSRYNPYKNKDLAKFRRNLVLNNLLDNDYINKKTHKRFTEKEIILKKRKKIYLEDARYYVEDVRKSIVAKYGFDKVYKQGFNIKTPINLELQKIATNALREGLILYDKRKAWRGPVKNKKYSKNWIKNLDKYKLEKSISWELAIVKKLNQNDIEIETVNKSLGKIKFKDIVWNNKDWSSAFRKGDIIYVEKIKNNLFNLRQLPEANGAVAVIDPFTGRVLALTGGFSFKQSEFNRATQALRQPGSAFKPFVYALALENNFTPSTLILDAPIVLDQGEDFKMWKPENYGKKFYGPSTMRTGLEKSRNLMTVRISQDLGLKKLTNFSKKLNIYENPKELYSISLGSAETTLLKLTAAYCSFVNGGKLIEPIYIDRIQDSEGHTIFNSEKRMCDRCEAISYLGNNYPKIKDNFIQIFSEETAYQLTSMLEGAVQRGTGRGLKDLNLNLAGKTGTTNKNTDAWFIGFTSNIVVGVYVGFDEPKTLGKIETGARAALPIFKIFMKNAIKSKDSRPFKVAKNIKMMVVDPITGEKAKFGSKKTIIEAYKKENIKNINLNNGNLKYRFNKHNILQFY